MPEELPGEPMAEKRKTDILPLVRGYFGVFSNEQGGISDCFVVSDDVYGRTDSFDLKEVMRPEDLSDGMRDVCSCQLVDDQKVDAVGVVPQRVFRKVFQEMLIVPEGDLYGADSGFVPVCTSFLKWLV